jgi:predicted alpha-1,2-mannosidase
MKNPLSIFFKIQFCLIASLANPAQALQNIEHAIEHSYFAKLVNPFIGTGGEGEFFPEGNTFPGAVLPWGMASVSPHTHYTTPIKYALGQPAASSGYHAQARSVEGFGLTHLSGVGCPELGAPVVAIQRNRLAPHNYRTSFENEKAIAGYYSAELPELNTTVQATATRRTGVMRFTFEADSDAYLLIDAAKNLSWRKQTGHIRFADDNTLLGWSQTGGFCMQDNHQKIYFAARVPASIEHGSWQWQGWKTSHDNNATGKVGGWWRVNAKNPTELYVAISYVSMENALQNLQQEIGDQGFKDILSQALNAWDNVLGKVAIKDDLKNKSNLDHARTFYTALYHSLLHPNLASDVNGDYLSYPDRKVKNNKQYPHYTVFSMWDSYRNVHSLLGLLYPQQQQEMIYTLEDMTLNAGYPPQWELLSSEVNMMVGDPALSIFSEAHKKGFHFKEHDQLFSILYRSANENNDDGRRAGNAHYMQRGYIPEGISGVWGSVSTTLEYSYHDWSLAQLALSLDRKEEHQQLIQQSSGWKDLYDDSTHTFRPKTADGTWIDDFDVQATSGERWIPHTGGPGFVEGNALHYAFMLPHQVPALIALHGGTEIFSRHLLEIFTEGQYVLWNEPDMLYPYLFARTGDLYRTQNLVRTLREKYFSDSAGGLPGNDDAGALSAWYVFSALGMYPVNPASGEYVLGSPLFDQLSLSLDQEFYSGKPLVIKKIHSTVPGAAFDQQALTSYTIAHNELIRGGELTILVPTTEP